MKMQEEEEEGAYHIGIGFRVFIFTVEVDGLRMREDACVSRVTELSASGTELAWVSKGCYMCRVRAIEHARSAICAGR